MSTIRRVMAMNKLDKLFKKAKKVPINKHSKIIIMSDIHRGIGNVNDNFTNNKLLYEKALRHYYNRGFTYVELGDGDEMWEVKDYNKIVENYIDIFKLLRKFYLENRFIMIYGNHDICKRNKKVLEKYFYSYYNYKKERNEKLFEHLQIYESLVLDYIGFQIFLLHGHQVDFLNSNIWRVSRFLVNHIWKKLEFIGARAPVTLAKNYEIENKNEKKLERWSIKNKNMIIAGHTHKAIFPTNSDSLYFNDGSCIHKDGITCLEIKNGKISLIKWFYKIKRNKILFKRKVLVGNRLIRE